MERVRFIEHRGQRVLLLDYSGLTDEHEILAMIDHRKVLMSEQEPGSVLTLTDATNARYSRAALIKIKEATVLDRPYVRRAAVVGQETLAKGLMEAVRTFSSRHWTAFETREAALDWLVSAESGDTARAV